MLRVVLAIVALLVVAFFVNFYGFSHGHRDELLVVTVRIEDRDTREPLDQAVAAILRYPGILDLESVELCLKDALQISDDDEAWGNQVAAARTTQSPVTTIRSSVYVTRYRFFDIQTSKKVIVPKVLLVEHPNFGRLAFPIDCEVELEPGDEEDTWRLDLGTVRVPR